MIESVVSIKQDLDSELYKYLKSIGYEFIAKSAMNRSLGNMFYIDKNSF